MNTTSQSNRRYLQARDVYGWVAPIRRWGHWVVFLLPTFLAALYFFAIASDQYESEAHFVVRSASRPETPGGLAILIQLGFGRSQDDSFIVQEFITSRDAVRQLGERLPLATFFDRPGVDFLAGYPSILYGPEIEQFYKYFRRMVSVVHVEKTGITTLRVHAFRPNDARDIAETLLRLSEELINRINRRLQSDAVENSLLDVRHAEARVIEAQTRLTEFRNQEMTIDPLQNAIALAELIAKLSSELGATQAQIAEMKVETSASPLLFGLRRKAAALEEQIAVERNRVAKGSDNLAARIANYERLLLEREFANRMLGAAEAALERARAEAMRQLLYLERIVDPHLSDDSTQPKRLRSVVTVMVANLILLAIGWLMFWGVREHASQH